MKKLLASLLLLCGLTAAHGQSAAPQPGAIAGSSVNDLGNGPLKLRIVQGSANIFTSQGSGTGSTSGASTSLTLTATPTTPPCVGCVIAGSGITAGTTIAAYAATSITLSAPMTVPTSTALTWGAACPASVGSAPYLQATASQDFWPLYTTARICALSQGSPYNWLLTQPFTVSSTGGTSFDYGTAGYALTGNGASVSTYQGFLQQGTNAVTRTWQSKAREVFSVKDFGAVCDGVTDDTTPLTRAVTAASASGAALYVPAGTCITNVTLNFSYNNATLYGDGARKSVIKLKAGSAFSQTATFGDTVGTTAIFAINVQDIGFDGNNTAANTVTIRNSVDGVYRGLRFSGGNTYGLFTTSSTATINTNQYQNSYLDIEADNNTGNGLVFSGEKDARFVSLHSHDNGGDGITFAGVNLGPNLLAETTSSVCSDLLTRSNTGSGFVFDQVEKFSCGSLLSTINSGYGLVFKSTITTAASNGRGNVNIEGFISRNDALGGIKTASGAALDSADFGIVKIIGFGSTVGGVALDLNGVTSVSFGTVDVVGWPGTAIRIGSGTPLGVLTQSNNVNFSTVNLYSNGNAGSATNHGVTIEDTTGAVNIGVLSSANSQTSGTNYELKVAAGVGNVNVASAYMRAAGGSANDYSIANATTFFGVGGVPSYFQYQVNLGSVNFNSANTDTCTVIPLPRNYTRYRLTSAVISGASATLASATFGVFENAGAAGAQLVTSGTAASVTTAASGTAGNFQQQAGATFSTTDTTPCFRVQTASAAPATANVQLNYSISP